MRRGDETVEAFEAVEASLVEEHPKMGHQPFHDSTSGAKVINSSESSKQTACFYQ